jgi:hypothetical protein
MAATGLAPSTNAPRSARGETALALVGDIDLRAATALQIACARGEAVALHVVEPGEHRDAFAGRWRRAHPTIPIVLLEQGETVAGTIVAHLVEARQAGALPVAVVVGALFLPHWWQRFLHDGSGPRIARAIAAAAGVEVVVAPVALPPEPAGT